MKLCRHCKAAGREVPVQLLRNTDGEDVWLHVEYRDLPYLYCRTPTTRAEPEVG